MRRTAPVEDVETVELYEAPLQRRLGEILVESRTIKQGAVRDALKRQKRERRPIGEILVDLGLAREQLLYALGRQMGMRPIDLDETAIEVEALDAVDAAIARALEVMPLWIDSEGRLHLASSRPRDAELVRALTQQVQRAVRLELADSQAVLRAIDRNYTVLDKVGEAADRAVADTGIAQERIAELAPLSPNAPVVQIVNLILTQGLRDRVSDIHIEPQADRLRIRYRIDGALRDVQSLPNQVAGAVASRLKIMADMDIVDRHRAQDGQTSITLDGRPVDIRISTMETVWGEKVVLRLLDRSRSLTPLNDLGLARGEHELLKHLIASPYGLFIVSGPTGAGKTTTLYAALNELDRDTRNITTIEDPVEYQFERINQIQINRLAGMTFANGLRAILRQDPDVILVGEVRDAETAQIAVQSALTGHLVMASLHAADSVGALHRFLDMGLEGYLIASAVIGVVAQRLVRLNCTECAVPMRPRADQAAFYRSIRGRDIETAHKIGMGCRKCSGTGYFERTGVFECMAVDETVREMIIGRATQAQVRSYARAQGMRSLQDAVCDLVDEGRTTLAEAMRTVYVL